VIETRQSPGLSASTCSTTARTSACVFGSPVCCISTETAIWPSSANAILSTRHHVLATILQRVSAPLKKADLLAVARYLIGHLSYSHVPALAKRPKIEAKKDSASAHELLAKQVGAYDESELCKLLLEISLLDSAYQRSTASRDDVLMDAAKRYRVDTENLQKAVAREFAAKRDQKAIRQKARKTAD
jgi:hypothetical protein